MTTARRAAPVPAVLAAALALLAFAAACPAPAPERRSVSPQGDRVLIDLPGIPERGGRFFTYRPASGGRVDFLVYRESGGEARAVLDACTDCYRWRKGYRLEGDGVVCVKCGMHFRLDDLREGLGACLPIALPAIPSGETLAIPVAALEAGARYF